MPSRRGSSVETIGHDVALSAATGARHRYRKLLASGGHDELHLPREPSALRELDRDGAFLDELCPPGPVAVAA